MVQNEKQSYLLDMLPKIHQSLESGSYHILKTTTHFKAFNLNLPELSEIQCKVLTGFSKACAAGLQVQRGREYGFSNDPLRATDLATVPLEILDQLPTHNLWCERDLGHFDYLFKRSRNSYNRNSTFSGKEYFSECFTLGLPKKFPKIP